MSAPKFPLPFCIEASDSSRNFQMVVSHLARGPFFRWSPLFFSLPLDLYSESECVFPMVAQSEKLRTTVQALVPRDLGGKERLKNGALSNYVPPFFPGYHDFNGDAHPGKIEVNESGWGGSWADRETEGKKRKNARLAGESGVQDGRDLLRSGRRTRDEERERKRETAR